jgi:hypothetical protein
VIAGNVSSSRPVRRSHDVGVRVWGDGVCAAAVGSVPGACRSRSSAVGGPPLYVSSSSSSTGPMQGSLPSCSRHTRRTAGQQPQLAVDYL